MAAYYQDLLYKRMECKENIYLAQMLKEKDARWWAV
jgi:hypothetical protein